MPSDAADHASDEGPGGRPCRRLSELMGSRHSARKCWRTIRSPELCLCFAIVAPRPSRYWSMMDRVSGYARRSSKQKTPKSSAFQKSGGPPIIAVSALLKLAEWWESRVIPAKAEGGTPCPDKEVCLPPPAPRGKGSRSARPTLDAASTGQTAASTANSGARRGSATRAASRKGGGR